MLAPPYDLHPGWTTITPLSMLHYWAVGLLSGENVNCCLSSSATKMYLKISTLFLPSPLNALFPKQDLCTAGLFSQGLYEWLKVAEKRSFWPPFVHRTRGVLVNCCP